MLRVFPRLNGARILGSLRRARLGTGLLCGALFVLSTGGCGGDEARQTTASPPAPARAAVACDGPAVAGDLPADFPRIAGVTYTQSVIAGPSTIVDGYYEGRLADAYKAYRAALRKGTYDVIFDELEARDSEVAYIGGKVERSGVVALRDNCAQAGRISVHITNRPT